MLALVGLFACADEPFVDASADDPTFEQDATTGYSTDAMPDDEDPTSLAGTPTSIEDEDPNGGVGPFGPGPGPGPDVPPLLELDRLVGLGIAGSTGHAYAWTAAKTVSAGLPEQLTWHRSPYRWTSSVNSGVVDMAISSIDRTYVWFANGTGGKGQTSNPTLTSTWAYTLPGGRTPADIVGIAIRKSDDRTHAYYDDGTYSTGTTTTLGANSCCSSYTLPPGKSMADIVGMDFAPNNRLHTWYDDETYSIGTANDLDAYQAPRRYARHGMLASRWPADAPNVVGPATDWPPEHDVDDYDGPQLPSPPASTFDVPVGGNSSDLLVAPGHDAIGMAFDASVYFYDKEGVPLSGGGLSASGRLPLEQMFAEFVRTSPVTPGQEAPRDVNQYIGFPEACDGPAYPTTSENGYCVSTAPYDTRVHFDPVGGRFVILANLRNRLWSDYFSNQYANPELSDAELYAMDMDDYDGCGVYEESPGSNTLVPEGAHCKLPRRLLALAVSRTADPRDGFFTWVFLENNYRDWPWMAIDDGWIILSHKGGEQPQGPAATLVSLADLRVGKARPQYINYYAPDLGGRVRVEPPQQVGTWPGNSLVVDMSADDWWFFALPHPPQPYAKQPAAMLAATLEDASGFSREKTVFRNDMLHLVGAIETESTSHVRHIRMPLFLLGGQPTISTSTNWGYVTDTFLPPFGKLLDAPMVAVNGADETLMAWGFAGTDPNAAVPPGVQHEMLRTGASDWDLRAVFREGDGYAEGLPSQQLKAISAAVDPVDDRTFWVTHKYGTALGQWGVVVGAVDPS